MNLHPLLEENGTNTKVTHVNIFQLTPFNLQASINFSYRRVKKTGCPERRNFDRKFPTIKDSPKHDTIKGNHV